MTSTSITLSLSSALFLVAATANAQAVSSEFDQYTFIESDNLFGQSLDSQGERVQLRVRPARTLLIRPRISFVPPMLKSVENL